MGIILLVLLLALILGGLGFAIHILWWIALVVLVIWLIGFAVRVGEGTSAAAGTAGSYRCPQNPSSSRSRSRYARLSSAQTAASPQAKPPSYRVKSLFSGRSPAPTGRLAGQRPLLPPLLGVEMADLGPARPRRRNRPDDPLQVPPASRRRPRSPGPGGRAGPALAPTRERKACDRGSHGGGRSARQRAGTGRRNTGPLRPGSRRAPASRAGRSPGGPAQAWLP